MFDIHGRNRLSVGHQGCRAAVGDNETMTPEDSDPEHSESDGEIHESPAERSQGAFWGATAVQARLSPRLLYEMGEQSSSSLNASRGQVRHGDIWILRLVNVVTGCACLWAIVAHIHEFCTNGEQSKFIGPDGRVALWLKIEAITSFLLPIMSLAVLLMRLEYSIKANCLLYCISAFQTAWFIVGCAWAFGNDGVPKSCRVGSWGDNVAYLVVWWICVIWLAMVICLAIVACFIGWLQLDRIRRMWRESQKIIQEAYARDDSEKQDMRDMNGCGKEGREEESLTSPLISQVRTEIQG